MWTLRGSDAAANSWTFRVQSGAVKTVGRTTGADFVVDAALVSRIHCRLEAAADGLHVTDLSSTNGTWVNGKRIGRARLITGDRLRVGRVELNVSSE